MNELSCIRNLSRHRLTPVVALLWAVVLASHEARAGDERLTAALRRACIAQTEQATVAESMRPTDSSPIRAYAKFCHTLTRETILKFKSGFEGYVCTVVLDETDDDLLPRPSGAQLVELGAAAASSETADTTPVAEANAAQQAALKNDFDALFGRETRERIEAGVRDELIRSYSAQEIRYADIYLLVHPFGRVTSVYSRSGLLEYVSQVVRPSEVMRIIGLKGGAIFGGCGALSLDRHRNGTFTVEGIGYHPGGCAPIERLSLEITQSAQVKEIARIEGEDAVCLE